MAEVRRKAKPATPIEVWFQDEMRVGQKNKLTYLWARKGTRPRLVHDQRTQVGLSVRRHLSRARHRR